MEIDEIFSRARGASKTLATAGVERINAALGTIASLLRENSAAIIEANSADVARMDPSDPKVDRLRLDAARIEDIAAGVEAVAALPSPVGITLSETVRPNGMKIAKVTVPFGVIGVIYEARPNVTVDVAALCLKAGSAVLLKGGHDASASNVALTAIISAALKKSGIDPNAVQLMPDSHEATGAMLHGVGKVDLIIPRGGKGLIEWVRDNARVPVIETGAGVCHTYFHTSGRADYAAAIVNNAKTRRPSVCNSLDTLIVDSSRLVDLPEVVAPLLSSNVEIAADERAFAALDGHYPLLRHAAPEDFGHEWLDYKMSIATVDGIDEALDFIERNGSRHSESIVAEDAAAQRLFTTSVDAACVYVNVSTAFTDGGQFGFGAEIGISTQKLHARGPMALPEITTYKYIITGEGNVR